jgi:hypothetical protein
MSARRAYSYVAESVQDQGGEANGTQQTRCNERNGGRGGMREELLFNKHEMYGVVQ